VLEYKNISQPLPQLQSFSVVAGVQDGIRATQILRRRSKKDKIQLCKKIRSRHVKEVL